MFGGGLRMSLQQLGGDAFPSKGGAFLFELSVCEDTPAHLAPQRAAGGVCELFFWLLEDMKQAFANMALPQFLERCHGA